jgi:hypothetical protein
VSLFANIALKIKIQCKHGRATKALVAETVSLSGVATGRKSLDSVRLFPQ